MNKIQSLSLSSIICWREEEDISKYKKGEDSEKGDEEAINNGRDGGDRRTRWFALLRLRRGFVEKVAVGRGCERELEFLQAVKEATEEAETRLSTRSLGEYPHCGRDRARSSDEQRE